MPSPTTLAALRAFVEEREWDQFHTPENLAKSIAIESGELLECFQWGGEYDQTRVEEELADVVTYCIHLANRIGVDLDEIVLRKLESTRTKYPADQARGRMVKYTQLAAEREAAAAADEVGATGTGSETDAP
ncbi:MAG: nucleotide pyrophosphohydrolase [Actinobacteria bacterium]|nr:nucleotide pyrophosphohydrolase [Actinomycetota bacterium]